MEYLNPQDNQIYYKYNHKYFEEDRPNKNWSKMPDLFGDDQIDARLEDEESPS